MWPIPLPRLLSGVERQARCRVRGTAVEPEVRQALETAGLLSYAGTTEWLTCSDCDEVGCAVLPLGERTDGTPIYQVLCQRGEYRLFTEGDLAEWDYTAAGLADLLARLLGSAVQATQVIPARLWSLGASTFAGVSVAWFFGVGTTQPDALALFRGASVLHTAPVVVVLTPTEHGDMACFAPHVVAWPVTTLLRVVQTELRFDPVALEALARAIVARETKPVAKAAKIAKWLDVPSGTTWEQVLFTFHNTDALTIQAPGTPQGEVFTYEELGFWDDRTSDPAAERYIPDALWRRFLRFAALYLPDEAVTRAAWAGPETKQLANVKSWAYQINQRLQAVVRGMATSSLPIVGKQGVYTANFIIAHGAIFCAEMRQARQQHRSRSEVDDATYH